MTESAESDRVRVSVCVWIMHCVVCILFIYLFNLQKQKKQNAMKEAEIWENSLAHTCDVSHECERRESDRLEMSRPIFNDCG